MKLKIKDKKSISAVIITKDRPKYFLNAIKSVLNQSNKVNEIIVIDNGKKKLDFNNKKIKYFRTNYAIGSSRARNLGIKKSKSKYCAFLDDDDAWDKNYIKKSKKFLNEKYVLVGKVFSISTKKIIKSKSLEINNKSLDQLFIRNPGIIGSNLIVSKQILKKLNYFDKNLPLGQDKAIAIESILKGYKVLRTSAKIFFNENTLGQRNTGLVKYIKGKFIFYKKYKNLMNLFIKIDYFLLFMKNTLYILYSYIWNDRNI